MSDDRNGLAPAGENDKLVALPVQTVPIPGGVLVKRGAATFRIDGDESVRVLELVFAAANQAGATRSEIMGLFPEDDRESISDLLDELERRYILVPATSDIAENSSEETQLDLFCWHLGTTPTQVSERLSQVRMTIVGVNAISRQLVAALREAGARNIRWLDSPDLRGSPPSDPVSGGEFDSFDSSSWPPSLQDVDLLVATSDFGGLQLLRRWNELCMREGVRFLPVVLQYLMGFIGPLAVRGETACFECLRARQNSHLVTPEIDRITEYVAGAGRTISASHPVMTRVLGDMAAMEIIKAFGVPIPFWNSGRLIEVDLLNSSVTSRKVLQIPRCAVCAPVNVVPSVNLEHDPFHLVSED